MKKEGRRGLAGVTASWWVALGASFTIIPWAACFVLAKLIQAGLA